MYSKFDANDSLDAIKQFESYINYRKKFPDISKQVWELLTGDWKHVCYWCVKCDRVTYIVECKNCEIFKEMKGIGEKNEGLS